MARPKRKVTQRAASRQVSPTKKVSHQASRPVFLERQSAQQAASPSIFPKQAVAVMLFFLAAQFLGLFTGIMLVNAAQVYPEFQSFNVAPGGDSGSPYTSAFFLVYVLVGAVGMILLIKFYKGAMLFRLLEAASLFIASNIVFYVFLMMFAVPYDWLWAMLLSGAVTAARFLRPGMKNFAAVMASAGIGAVFGFSLDILPAIIFVAGLSLYDFIAVFWTKHMLYMARELGKRNLAFSVSATEKEWSEETQKDEPSTLELGTGDMVIPLMLAVSAYRISFSMGDSLAVVAGGFVGLAAVLWYVTSRRTFLPALPPIAFFALIGLAISRLIAALVMR